jgi:hypothetical protein
LIDRENSVKITLFLLSALLIPNRSLEAGNIMLVRYQKKWAWVHEDAEGYAPGDATAEMILKIPHVIKVDTGWPSDEVLRACGANFLSEGSTRVVEIGNRKFCEGLMESTLRSLDDDIFEALGENRLNKTKKSNMH